MKCRYQVQCLMLACALLACQSDSMKRADFPTVEESALKGVARTSLDSPKPTRAQLQRRERSLAHLASLDVPSLSTLPVVEDESAITPRSVTEIAERCIAMALCAVKGESNDHAFAQELLDDYKARSFLSPNETAFMANPSPDQQELIDAAWGYEVVHVLLWALGFVDEIQPPNQICDVPAEVRTIRDRGTDGLVREAKPRSMAEILDRNDLYYHLHWSAIELRLRGESSTALDEGIIRERHRALNWLIHYLDQEWDDVTTDT
jgi:hypothetical protein